MKTNYNNEVMYLTFPALEEYPEIIHAMSTREGGVSTGYFSSMNLGVKTDDDKNNIAKNYELFSQAIGISSDSIALGDLTHGDNVHVATIEDKGSGITKPFNYTDVDALITNVPGVNIAVTIADCVPVYFYDPVNKAVGIAHSGWKGTANEISDKVVEAMKANYGTRPEDLICGIGASIGMCCYEVSRDVVEEFLEFDYLDDACIFDKENGKYDMDLSRIIFGTLAYAGVDPDNIHISGMCTCCNSDILFSHRASHGKRGTMLAVIGIRE